MSEKLEDVYAAEISAFYEKEMPRLVLFVKTLSGSLDGHAAADIAQTAFERALPRWPTLRYPKAWLYRVAHNEAMTRIAALQREMPTEVLPDRPDEMSVALAAEWRAEQRDMLTHLQALAPTQRQVMTWTLAGFSDAEIAEALELTTNAVKQNRYRAEARRPHPAKDERGQLHHRGAGGRVPGGTRPGPGHRRDGDMAR